jgi:hypothetical protein
LNTKNLKGKVKWGLRDPFASNLECFPWLKLQISIGVERGEREEKRGEERGLHGLDVVNAGE